MRGREAGNAGETAACAYLQKKGWHILERNYTVRGGEIDIIAADGACIVFVEVKARKNTLYGYPSEFVSEKKKKRLISAALDYCGDDCCMRFDVIEVMYEEICGRVYIKEINHIENAFEG